MCNGRGGADLHKFIADLYTWLAVDTIQLDDHVQRSALLLSPARQGLEVIRQGCADAEGRCNTDDLNYDALLLKHRLYLPLNPSSSHCFFKCNAFSTLTESENIIVFS